MRDLTSGESDTDALLSPLVGGVSLCIESRSLVLCSENELLPKGTGNDGSLTTGARQHGGMPRGIGFTVGLGCRRR